MQLKDIPEKSLVSTDRVTIEVSGKKFKAKTEHFLRHPETRLGRMFSDRKNPDQFHNDDLIFDRPVGTFEAILSYYQTNKLHIPVNVCPKAFQGELEFWEIDPSNLENCCLYKYMSYLNECKSISTFQDYIADEQVRSPSKVWRGRCNNFRNRLWIILSNKDKSKLTKVYLFISMIMIAMSLTSLILGTIPELQTPITTCDMKKLLTELEMYDQIISNVLDSLDCLSDPIAQLEELIGSQNKTGRRHKREGTGQHGSENTMITDDKAGSNNLTTESTKVQTTTVSDGSNREAGKVEDEIQDNAYQQTNEDIDINPLTEKQYVAFIFALNKLKDLYFRKPIQILLILDDITVAFFTLELLLRLVSCPSYKQYFKSIINVIDIIILLAAYINYIVTKTTIKAEYDKKSIVRIFQYFQMFRVLRVLRITQGIIAVRVLGYSLRRSLKDILALAIYLFIGVMIFSTFVYFSENTKQMKSIPDACWWGVITMTTVGYGDIVPKSPLGRLVGSICAISGLIMLSMVIPVFVNNFLSVYQVAKLQDALRKLNHAQHRKVSEVKVYPIKTKE